MIDTKELRQSLGAVQPEEVAVLLDRLEEAESDALEQARLNGMGASREAALMAKLEAAEKSDAESIAMYRKARDERESWKGVAQQFGNEADELRTHLSFAKDELNRLRAKIAEMERQEPVATVRINAINGNPSVDFVPGHRYLHHNDKLYLAPGAQPAPSFADAYQGAMEEVAIWKRRALEAEDLNRKFIAEINGPAYMGEPAQPAPSALDARLRSRVADLLHLLQFAQIACPTAGDSEQAESVMADLKRTLEQEAKL